MRRAVRADSIRTNAATSVGLLAALLGPYVLLVSVAPRSTSDPYGVWRMGAFWALFGFVVAIVVMWERRPLASIGLGHFTPRSLGFGILAGCVIVLVFPVLQTLLEAVGLQGYRGDIDRVLQLPWPIRVASVLSAGIVEETLYRGYAIERMTELTRSRWMGAVAPLALFTIAHAFSWAPSHLITIAVVGGLLTLLYLWRHELWMCIVAHTLVDAIGFLVVPLAVRG